MTDSFFILRQTDLALPLYSQSDIRKPLLEHYGILMAGVFFIIFLDILPPT